MLLEQATTAWRPTDPDGSVRAHPAWADLDARGREELHDLVELQRRIEATLDDDGLSTTGRAVLARIRAAPDRI